MTTRSDGDQRWRSQLPNRRPPGRDRAVQRWPSEAWTLVHQVHGRRVVSVDRLEGPIAEDADGIASGSSGVVAVLGADCGLIGLASPEGVIAVAHAGWKGLVAGVIEEAVNSMYVLGATRIEAVLGPMIGVECYPFSPSDVDLVVARYGTPVRGRATCGSVALDLRAGILVALGRAEVTVVAEVGGCTACDDTFYSWRGRHEEGRHALALWREPVGSSSAIAAGT